MSSTPVAIQHVDYAYKAKERQKELEELRSRSLTTDQGTPPHLTSRSNNNARKKITQSPMVMLLTQHILSFCVVWLDSISITECSNSH